MRGRLGDAIVQRDHARHLLASCAWGRRNAGLDDLEQGEVDVAQPAADCRAQSLRTTPTSSRSSNWPPLGNVDGGDEADFVNGIEPLLGSQRHLGKF